MKEKVRKTLYLPLWVAEILDNEGVEYDGPGVIAAACIYDFSERKKPDKMKALKAYRDKEIVMAYEGVDEAVVSAILDENAAGRASAKSQRKRGESAQASKSG